ncbi:MAG: PA0069 family radical SAM protein, partial [Verrucomicrobia bacterium]|nr:PA0069 family radical SAM protein [Verrucomicrobiota bacterium]
DRSASVVSHNESPDIPYRYSLNPYRGCEHGCAYCYARPTHEYLGFSCGLDFETRIVVKPDAPRLLRAQLAAGKIPPRETLTLSGVTDPYQPAERRFRLTRGCLKVLAELDQPVCVVTKNHLVTRDADLLSHLARTGKAAVSLSIASLDPELTRRLEPRASAPAMRLAAVRALAAAGMPAGVLVAPVIPGLTDHEIPAILQAAAAAGALWAGMSIVRLPHSVADIFADWLERHVPLKRERVLNRIRAFRGGRLNDSRFGTRLTGSGPEAERLARWFEVCRRRAGINGPRPAPVFAARKPDPQLRFEGF